MAHQNKQARNKGHGATCNHCEEMSGNMDVLISNMENLKHLPHQLNNMQKQLACMTEEMQGIKLAMHNLETENKKLKQQNVHLENQVLNLGNQINDLEQYGRRQNLEIQGVAMNDDQETPQELELKVLSVLQHVDGSTDKDDIDVMHRLGPRKIKKTQKQDMPPSIIVRFISRKKRNALCKARKNLKDAKCDFLSSKGVFLNENLTPKNRQICYFMPTRKGRIISGNICGLQMEEFLLEKVTTALPFK